MFYPEEITIKEMIVHILDSSMPSAILSKQAITQAPGNTEFFMAHIVKLLNDDAIKDCVFVEDQNMFLEYMHNFKEGKWDLITCSSHIAEKLFAILQNNEEIPPADLGVVHFLSKSVPYLAILKLNYQRSFIHDSDYESEEVCNHILEYRTALPSPTQRISEGLVINLDDMSIQIVERSYYVDQVKQPYLSKILLQCETRLSSKEQYNIVKNAAQQVTKKFYDNDPEKKMSITKELYEAIQEDGIIELEQYASRSFDPDVKEAFMETCEKKGIEDQKVVLQEKTIEKAFSKQKIRTKDGIEITIPMEFYNDSSKVQIETDMEGRSKIVIKNISIL